MILQSIIYPCDVCEQKEIYYQSEQRLIQYEDKVIVPTDSKVSFFSYMNAFDCDVWKKYTSISNVQFLMKLTGKGCVALRCKTKEKDVLLEEQRFDILASAWKEIIFELNLKEQEGFCYFEIISESAIQIKTARFETQEKSEREVHIALNICTYHRNQEIKENIAQLRKSRFFNRDDSLYHKLSVVVVDNGSELEKIKDSNIRLVHNRNTGGSGGFKRGLEELRKWDVPISHVVFMDDDVEFVTESLYRLYALLSYLRREYWHEPVAGRMFRTDNRFIQYTAAEIWNKGELRHIGLNADMTQECQVLLCNENGGAEYGGWWFCCYPMEFARENDPLPFFIHCDDVEYGLRHGGTPIILNGVQVWHETYEYRQSLEMLYYDTRNSLIVNILYTEKNKEIIFADWKEKITAFHVKNEFLSELIVIHAMHDFLKGRKWFLKKGKTRFKVNLQMSDESIKLINKIYWRYCKHLFLNKYDKLLINYRKGMNK